MHETTSKWLCRAAFVVLAVLPALWLLGLGLVRVLPWHRHAWESRLSEQLGVEIRLSEITHPRPHVLRLDGVNVVDPETGQPLATADSLRADNRGDACLLTAQGLSLKTTGLARLSARLHERLLCSAAAPAVVFTSDEVNLLAATTHDRLHDISAQLEAGPNGPRAVIRFRAVETAAEPAQLRLERNRRLGEPSTRIELATGPAGLPTRLAAPWTPEGAPAATTEELFHGILTCETAAQSGQLRRITLHTADGALR